MPISKAIGIHLFFVQNQSPIPIPGELRLRCLVSGLFSDNGVDFNQLINQKRELDVEVKKGGG